MLITKGLVITLDPERRVICDGAVAIEGDRIVAVGKTGVLEKKYGSDKAIDASGKIVMPGLVNAHNHIYQLIGRGLRADGRLQRWREKSKIHWKIDYWRNLNKEACYATGTLGAIEMLRSGITCTQDSHYINFHKDAVDGIAQSMLDSGMRLVLGRGCWDAPGLVPDEYTEDVATAVRESERVISDWHGRGDGRITVRGESSTLGQCTNEMILATKELARKHGIGWTLHVETRLGSHRFSPRAGDPEVARLRGRSIEYLYRLGVLGPDTLLIHCHLIDDSEVAMLARTKTAVAHCPAAYAVGGGSIIGPLPYMLERGVKVGLGVDGAQTNDSQDLFQSMKICALLHKFNKGHYYAVTAEKLLEMSTIDSARALQLEGEIGSLEVGKKADLILLDLNTPGLTPNLLPVKNIVYSAANGNAVDTVIIDGKTVMKGKEITTFDERQAYRDAEESAQKLIQESGELTRDPTYLKPSPWRYI